MPLPSQPEEPHIGPVTASALAKLLGVYSQRGDWYDGHCPAHDDEHPSFSFSDGRGGLVVICHADCPFHKIAAALRKRFPKAKFVFSKQQPGRKPKIIEVYQYHDEPGQILYEAVRFEPKTFRFRRDDGHKGWIWNLDGVRRVLYGLPDLKGQEVVWVTEGEKDANRLKSSGLPATTNPGGAGNWTDEFTAQLKAAGARSINILPDNDHVGGQHARQVARSALQAGLEVRIVQLPGLPESGDVSDWLGQGHTIRELRTLAAKADLLTEPLPEESEEEHGAPPIGSGLADRLVALADASGIRLFHTPRGEAFAVMPVQDHEEVWPLTGETFKLWLSRLLWQEERKAVKPDVLTSAIQTLAARARFDGPEEEVHLRTAWFEGALYYDLGDANWRVVKITPGKWEILSTSPVRFRRYSAMAAQAEPQAGGSLTTLWELINVLDLYDQRLLEAWLVSALIPGIPRPVLVLYGDQGAGKTTTARMLGALVDPNHAPLVRARDEAEFTQALAHHYVAILDNLSYLPEWLSNLLSRAVTGEAFNKRRLYTDDEDIIYSFRRVLILTGINLVVTKADLLDRALLVGTERLEDKQRIEDRALTERFTAAQSKLFGAVLDLLAQAMAAYPTVTPKLPRMADFGRWGAALAQAQGRPAGSFEKAYEQNIARQNEQAIAESFTATLLLTFMENRPDWIGTITELLGHFQSLAESIGISKRDFPGSPQLLGRRLREVRPNLAAVGYDVSFSGHHHPRTVLINRNRNLRRP